MRYTMTDGAGRWATLSFTAATILALAGCAATGPVSPRAAPAGPEPQLLSIGTLDLPGTCAVTDGTVYRTSFTVGSDGRVTGLRPDPGPACLQSALTTWIASARYVPPPAPTPAVFDWLATSATRLR